MATFQEYEDKVKANLAEISTGLDTVITGIQALKDQIAAGSSVSEEDFAELETATAEVKTKVQTASS